MSARGKTYRHVLPMGVVTHLALFLGLLSAGCSAGEKQPALRDQFYAGELSEAHVALSEDFSTQDRAQSLLLMDRALVHLREGNFVKAREDLVLADEELEILDFSGEQGPDLELLLARPARFDYFGAPYEKILVNTLNALNNLALVDLEEGRIEARRSAVLLEDVVDFQERHEFENPLSELLYGLVFEASDRPNDAYLAYERANEIMDAEFLGPLMLRSARAAGHSAAAELEDSLGKLPKLNPEWGRLVVVLMNGKGPRRVPTLTADRSLRYGELRTPEQAYQSAAVRVGERPEVPLELALDIGDQAEAWFERIELKTLLGSRIKTLQSGGFGQNRGARNLYDPRCWQLLPASIHITVIDLPPGEHDLSLDLEGARSRTLSGSAEVTSGETSVALFWAH